MLVKNYTKVILAAKKESSPFTKDDLGGNLLWQVLQHRDRKGKSKFTVEEAVKYTKGCQRRWALHKELKDYQGFYQV